LLRVTSETAFLVV